MRRFSCPSCGSELFFDSNQCERCDRPVAYAPDDDALVVVRTDDARCASVATVEACNWLRDDDGMFCRSCRLDTDHAATELRAPFQAAKRRTLRLLLALGVDLTAEPPLRFELEAGTPDAPVTTGHADGTITLDVAEGDPSHLEEVREDMGEPYRTPLGHVRHELGHWWWQSAQGHAFTLDDFRATFGDERADYAESLRSHYAAPDDGSWQAEHLSHYAAAHPWEDFAESFAHLLHLMDTLETARAHGVVEPASGGFDEVWSRWVECTIILNDLNRAMGTPDPYPFVVPQAAIDKVRFIARAIGLDSSHLSA